VVTEMVREHSK